MASVEQLKLKAITSIASAKDDENVKDALIELIKKLQIAAPPAEGAVPAPGGPAVGTSAALEAFKAALKLRGTHGIFSIGKKFKSMDDDGDSKLRFDEFKKAVGEVGISLSEGEVTKLFRHFDVDASGFLSFDEFLVGLKGELSPRREALVEKAFKVLDKTGDGSVTLADLEGRYDASRHPDVVAGVKGEKDVLAEFLSVFEAQGGGTAGDGKVDLEEFKKYYSMISASVDHDDYFELLIRNAWHISGGEGWSANTTCKRVLVTHTDGTQTVEEVKDDFDVNVKDLGTVKARLEEQGVKDIKSVALYGGFDDVTPAVAAPPHKAPNTAAAGTASATSAGVFGGGPPSARPSTRGRGQTTHSNIIFG